MSPRAEVAASSSLHMTEQHQPEVFRAKDTEDHGPHALVQGLGGCDLENGTEDPLE